MTQEEKDLYKALNANLAEWGDDEQLKPHKIAEFQLELENFYFRAGKRVVDPTKFSTRVKLTPEQEDELLEIAITLANYSSDIEEYEEFFLKNKERFGFDSIDDTITFINAMDAFKSDAMLQAILSSEETRELYEEGLAKGLDFDDIDALVYEIYNKTGKTFEDLYWLVLREIEAYDAEKG